MFGQNLQSNTGISAILENKSRLIQGIRQSYFIRHEYLFLLIIKAFIFIMALFWNTSFPLLPRSPGDLVSLLHSSRYYITK